MTSTHSDSPAGPSTLESDAARSVAQGLVGIATMDPRTLKAHPDNAKDHPDDQMDALRESYLELGTARRILVNEVTGYVLDGHARLRKALEDGDETVEVDLGRWTPEKEPTVLGLLDAIAEMARRNDKRFAALRSKMDLRERPAMSRLADRYADAAGGSTGDEAGARVGPPPAAKPEKAEELRERWKVHQGQVWEADSWTFHGGFHRLMCGDSTDEADVNALIGTDKIALLHTDPPYGVDYDDANRVRGDRVNGNRGRKPKWDKSVHNDKMTTEELRKLVRDSLALGLGHGIPSLPVYVWHAVNELAVPFYQAFADLGLLMHSEIIWLKTATNFDWMDYHSRHESAIYGWPKGTRCEFLGPRNQTSVWEIPHETSRNDRLHQTQKPLELFRRPIRNHTIPGDVVYDPFGGSFTQVLAAEYEGRQCRAMDLAPKCVAIGLQRLHEMGLKPRKVYG